MIPPFIWSNVCFQILIIWRNSECVSAFTLFLHFFNSWNSLDSKNIKKRSWEFDKQKEMSKIQNALLRKWLIFFYKSSLKYLCSRQSYWNLFYRLKWILIGIYFKFMNMLNRSNFRTDYEIYLSWFMLLNILRCILVSSERSYFVKMIWVQDLCICFTLNIMNLSYIVSKLWTNYPLLVNM